MEHWVVAHRGEPFDTIFVALSRIGSVGFVWLVLAVLAVWLWRKPVVFPLVLIAWLAAEVTARLLKEVVTRERPHDHPLVAMLHAPSFPSGHATTGFACAATMARFAPSRRAAVALYALAVLIAYSRVYVGVHYPLDVLGGALLALLIATALRMLPVDRRRSPRAPRAG